MLVSMASMTRTHIRSELAWVYIAVAGVTALVTYLPSPILREYGAVVLAVAFLFGALGLARRDADGPARFGISLSGVLEPPQNPEGQAEPLGVTAKRAARDLGREFTFACVVALAVFPPFVLAYRVLHGVTQPFTLHLPGSPFDFALGQLILVALPEEALFRGYFQTRLEDLYPPRANILGAQLSWPAIVVQAALFAALHFLVGFAPARLSVFFPGLLFGWMRARRGGVGAGSWFHALSNLLAEVLARGYL
jgi:membrane protease YdiL (CAAX protease family)